MQRSTEQQIFKNNYILHPPHIILINTLSTFMPVGEFFKKFELNSRLNKIAT